MRYAVGGGLTAQGRSRRSRCGCRPQRRSLRMRTPDRSRRSQQVSTKSTYQWRRAWQARGEAAFASKAVGGSFCELDDGQLRQLRAALDAGPAAYEWEQDQQWTLAGVAALVMRLFGVPYTLRGISFLLHRLGNTPQVPAHHAFEGRGRRRRLADGDLGEGTS